MADEGFKRKLTAILSADVEGYSRLMGDDDGVTVRTLTAYLELFFTLIQQHNGKELDSQVDNLPAEFVSAVDAVQCGVAVQKEISARHIELPESRRMQFRIGINLGAVIQEEGRIYGDGVNMDFAYASPGYIYLHRRQYEKAITAGERAIVLNPNGADAHAWLGHILCVAGRPAEGLALPNQGSGRQKALD